MRCVRAFWALRRRKIDEAILSGPNKADKAEKPCRMDVQKEVEMLDARLGGWLVLGILLMAAQGPCSPVCPDGSVATQSGLCMVELRPGRGWRALQNGDISVRLAEQGRESSGLYGFWLVELPEELRAESGVRGQLGSWKLVIRRDGDQSLPDQMLLRWRLSGQIPPLPAQDSVALVARWVDGHKRHTRQVIGHFEPQSGILQVKLEKWTAGTQQVELIPVRWAGKIKRQVARL